MGLNSNIEIFNVLHIFVPNQPRQVASLLALSVHELEGFDDLKDIISVRIAAGADH